ncbi:MAG: hypothetical protein Q4F84_01935, partial [Fibrobacter sp.]|nr:hypothetical protein [Fibrobacter sp.]
FASPVNQDNVSFWYYVIMNYALRIDKSALCVKQTGDCLLVCFNIAKYFYDIYRAQKKLD